MCYRVWREYPDGKIIYFHHFPDFHPEDGKPGDTLVWHPEKNYLKVVRPKEDFKALCYNRIEKYGGKCFLCDGK